MNGKADVVFQSKFVGLCAKSFVFSFDNFLSLCYKSCQSLRENKRISLQSRLEYKSFCYYLGLLLANFKRLSQKENYAISNEEKSFVSNLNKIAQSLHFVWKGREFFEMVSGFKN